MGWISEQNFLSLKKVVMFVWRRTVWIEGLIFGPTTVKSFGINRLKRVE